MTCDCAWRQREVPNAIIVPLRKGKVRIDRKYLIYHIYFIENELVHDFDALIRSLFGWENRLYLCSLSFS